MGLKMLLSLFNFYRFNQTLGMKTVLLKIGKVSLVGTELLQRKRGIFQQLSVLSFLVIVWVLGGDGLISDEKYS